MNWQDEVTPEQWSEWQEFARKVSQQKKINTTLGAEDYAVSAIEKLISQPKKPENVEAWIRKTINNQYIDRFRKIQARGGASMRELTDEQWEEEMISFAVDSPSAMIYLREYAYVATSRARTNLFVYSKSDKILINKALSV
jgi:DNA-directed RNA polymerase specialized sigma24 family protein